NYPLRHVGSMFSCLFPQKSRRNESERDCPGARNVGRGCVTLRRWRRLAWTTQEEGVRLASNLRLLQLRGGHFLAGTGLHSASSVPKRLNHLIQMLTFYS